MMKKYDEKIQNGRIILWKTQSQKTTENGWWKEGECYNYKIKDGKDASFPNKNKNTTLEDKITKIKHVKDEEDDSGKKISM